MSLCWNGKSKSIAFHTKCVDLSVPKWIFIIYHMKISKPFHAPLLLLLRNLKAQGKGREVVYEKLSTIITLLSCRPL